jgi:hypothetical protein
MAFLDQGLPRGFVPGDPGGFAKCRGPEMPSSRMAHGNPMHASADELVHTVGSKCTNLNMDGHQHHRLPFKNKEEYLRVKPLPEWNKRVEHRTRSELMQARKAERIPDMSYDLDGDGVVGQKDYFLSKFFDKDHKDMLHPHEREKAIQALKDGFQDRFQFGHDQSGAKRPFQVQQRRGRILNQDNVDEISETYPPHPNAHVVPKHKTRTELHHDRLGERKNAAYKMKVKWDERNPYAVPEQPTFQENWVDRPVIEHISQRAEADHQAARVRAGLLPSNTFVNPERESKHPGLHYEPDPVFQTRGQLLETRKELMKRDLDEQRDRGEQTYVPLTVRNNLREEAAYEFRRGAAHNMTKTKLHDNRKKERIEYDMAHFGVRMKELPRYTDQAHPWWTLKQHNRNMSEPSMAKEARPDPPCFKVTESKPYLKPYPKPEREPRQELVVAGKPQMEQQEPGIKTVKRWTTDIIEHNQMRNVPRLFDTLRDAQLYGRDFAPLDNFSSFDWTRNQSLRQQAEARRRNNSQVTRSRLDPSQFEDRESGPPVAQASYDMGRRARSQTGGSSSELRQRPRATSALGRSAPRSRADTGVSASMGRSQSVPILTRTAGGFSVRTGGFSRIDHNESASKLHGT